MREEGQQGHHGGCGSLCCSVGCRTVSCCTMSLARGETDRQSGGLNSPKSIIPADVHTEIVGGTATVLPSDQGTWFLRTGAPGMLSRAAYTADVRKCHVEL